MNFVGERPVFPHLGSCWTLEKSFGTWEHSQSTWVIETYFKILSTFCTDIGNMSSRGNNKELADFKSSSSKSQNPFFTGIILVTGI